MSVNMLLNDSTPLPSTPASPASSSPPPRKRHSISEGVTASYTLEFVEYGSGKRQRSEGTHKEAEAKASPS